MRVESTVSCIARTDRFGRNAAAILRPKSAYRGGQQENIDLIEFPVDPGDGLKLLAYDSVPGNIDTVPFPAALTKWHYRAIYRVDDHAVGQWSNPVSVTVGA